MHITSLVVEGFKSYKDRTELEFTPGLNVVVGKNGAGKSNVFGAIEFVLSNKYANLRSEDRQRLLHEGSGRGVLAAFVEITFDNSDRRLPDDKDVVSLKRVIGLKKDEYLLNNRHVSKTQVDNLLESAGFSRSNPYNIVQQGKVNSLLKMKDTARLDLLKEIAGTRVYDQRRSESLKIMHDTDNCRLQIAEISASLETRLQELEDEQEELRQYEALDRDRRSLEFTIFTLEQNSAERKLERADNDRDNLHQLADKAHSDNSMLEEKKQRLEAEFADFEKSLNEIEQEKEDLQHQMKRIVKKKAKLALIVRDLNSSSMKVEEEKSRNQDELAKVTSRIGEVESELRSITSSFSKAKSEEAQSQQAFSQCQSRVDELMGKQGRTRQFRNRKSRDAFLTEEISRFKDQVSALEEVICQTSVDLESLQAKKLSFIENNSVPEDAIQQAVAQIRRATDELTKLKSDRDEATNVRKDLWRQGSQHDSKLSELASKIQRAERTLHSTMPRDVRLGMECVKQFVREGNIQGVHGMVVELFQTEGKFQQCVETAAGNRLFHIIVDTDDIAARLLGLMRRAKAGRITFIPLNRIEAVTNSNFVESSDVIPMVEKLTFKPIFRNAMYQIFGKTVIARNLDVGAAYSREHSMSAITLDGDQVNKKGAMTGGFVDYRASRLKAMHELSELNREQAILLGKANIKEAARQKDQQISVILGEMQKREALRGVLRDRVVSLKNEQDQWQTNLHLIDQEITSKASSLTQMQSDLKHCTDSIKALSEEISSPFQASLSEEESNELSHLVDQADGLRKQLNECAQRRSILQGEKSKLESFIAMNLLVRQRELSDLIESVFQSPLDDNEKAQELQRLSSAQERLENEIQSLEDAAEELPQRIRSVQSNLEKLKEEEAASNDILRNHSLEMDKLANRRSLLLQKRDDCIRNVRGLGSLPSGAFEKYGQQSVSQLMDSLKKCRSDLNKFSHVNKKAIDQYVTFTEQRVLLRERKGELDRGKAAIEACITHLDQQKDDAIRRTFKSIAKNFSEVFSELVPGGKGTLIIHSTLSRGNEDREEDEEDEESRRQLRTDNQTSDRYSGVGIKVNFTGSGESFSVAQLSGGQQTVVALALIFAIQRCDPFPFYLFDEIDSNLDSAYRTSVAEMIARQCVSSSNNEIIDPKDDLNESMDSGSDSDNEKIRRSKASKRRIDATDTTQFICTTFRPEMLSFADQFFGVMHANKVSQVETITQETALSILESNEREIDPVGNE